MKRKRKKKGLDKWDVLFILLSIISLVIFIISKADTKLYDISLVAFEGLVIYTLIQYIVKKSIKG